MTNPTNWPNPERPGAPPSPFDQRPYLDHVLRRKSDNRLVDVRFFPRGGPGTGDWCFGNMNRMNEREAAERFHYHTPCLTPTQIAELLAAERERCAKLVQDLYNATPEVKILKLKTLFYAAKEIRNLGAAP